MDGNLDNQMVRSSDNGMTKNIHLTPKYDENKVWDLLQQV